MDWRRRYGPDRPNRIGLPGYPFDRRRCWIDVPTAPAGPARPAPAAGPVEEVAPVDPLFTPVWRVAPVEAAEQPPGPVLVCYPAAARGLARALAGRYPDGVATLVELGAVSAAAGPDGWRVDPGDPAGLARLRDALPRPRVIWFLGGLLDLAGAADEPGRLLARQQEAGVRALLRLARDVVGPLAGRSPLTWRVITNHACPAAGTPVRNPWAAGLIGLARVLENEHPQWCVPHIDVDLVRLPGDGDPVAAQVAGRLLDEPDLRGARIAYRGPLRYREALGRIALPEPAGPTIRASGGYLIAGGAGGIGLALANRLVTGYDARVVLLGRRPAAAVQARLAEVDPTGTRLTYLPVDVADPVAVRAVAQGVRDRVGVLRGVFHCAAVRNDHLVRDLDDRSFDEAVAAKSAALVALAEVFGADPLDFLVVFSSAQSFLGDPGLAGYAAGSTFADAYAHTLAAAAPYRVRSVNWGYWAGAGAVAGPGHADRLTRSGFRPISVAAGWQTTLRVLAGDTVQPVAVPASDELLARMGVPAPSPVRGATPAERATIESFHELNGELTRLAHGWLLRLFTAMGGWPAQDSVADLDTLLGRLQPVPRYHGLVGELIRSMAAAGHLARRGDGYLPEPAALAAVPADPAAALAALAARHPEVAVFPRLLALCLSRYPDLLRGRVLATDLLFPRSGTSLMERVYKGNPISDVYNDLLADAVAGEVVRRLPQHPPRPVRILEVGAGTGGTTAAVLSALDRYGERLEYWYTDLSAAFLDHGRREYGADRPYLRFRRLDADRDPAGQGFEAYGYDLVIAANAVHATRNVERALHHLNTLLRPGGLLVLNELTSVTLPGTATYGLFDGWWQHDDPEHRLPGSPLLDLPGWGRRLAAAGYGEVTAAPDGGPAGRNFQHVIVARVPVGGPAVGPGAQAVAPGDDRRDGLYGEILALAAEASGLEPTELDLDRELGEFGFDSVSYTMLANRLNDRYGTDLAPTVFYETPTLRALVDRLRDRYPHAVRADAVTQSPDGVREPEQAAPAVLPAAVPEPADRSGSGAAGRVAIVGMAGLLPGSADLDEFWTHLVNGDDLVGEVPADRWDWRTAYRRLAGNEVHGRWGGFVTGVDRFDPLFFGISPAEADDMDPQHRLVLEGVWTALEDAGIAPGSLAGSDTGLFIGVGSNDYQELGHDADPAVTVYGATANAHSILVNRVSHLLDLHGPSEPVNTGCSSSLVALHRAAAAVASGECAVAVAGGVNLLLSPRNYALLSRTGMLSPTGRCRTFDAAADGFVRGEGLGLVVLTGERRAARHRVRGWLLGSAVSHGGRARSLTAPNPLGQARMLVTAYRRAGIDPSTVSYIEAHGTGTPLGDPVEVNGLRTAFAELLGDAAVDRPYCALGTVKSNIGHLESAAGIAGVLKVLLAMEHGVLPPTLHVTRPNPYLELDGSPFYLATEATGWRPARDRQGREVPLRAGVSSFGYGGVNAHVVLERAEQPPAGQPAGPALFVLSARTPQALRRYADNLARHLRSRPELGLPAVAHTLRVGRDALEHRFATVAASREELVDALSRFAAGAPAGRWHTGTAQVGSGGVAGTTVGLDDAAARWVAGALSDWRGVTPDPAPPLVPLPTYPFERRRCWLPASNGTASSGLVTGGSESIGPAADGPAPTDPAPTDPAPIGPAADGPVKAGGADGLMYRPAWVTVSGAGPGAAPRSDDGPVWVVHTAAAAPLAAAVEARLGGHRVLRVSAASSGADLDRLREPAAVWFLGLSGADADPAAAGAELVLPLLRIVKRLASGPGAGHARLLVVVTADGCAVAGHPVRQPGGAALSGFARALRREYEHWRVITVDVAGGELDTDAARTVDGVLGAVSGGPQTLALREGRLLRPVLTPFAQPGPAVDRLRTGGGYVLIGGLGEIGSAVAAHLIDRYGARVALIGRSPLDADRRARLAGIDPTGRHAVYLSADASDPAALATAARVVTERFGAVHGVLHAANVLRDRAVAGLTEEQLAEGLAAKTRGSAAVAQVFGGHPLDFLAFFSSVQSWLGNPGQSAYAAACAFQDAYAHQLAGALPFPVRVVNWGAWGERGLVARHRDRLARAGVTAIRPEQGLTALTQVLGGEAVQVAVVSGSARFLAEIGVTGADPTADADAADGAGDRPAWRDQFDADLHELVCEVARVDPAELVPAAELSRFGFDSITYTQLAGRCNVRYGLDITPGFFFGLARVGDIAAKLARQYPADLRDRFDPAVPAAPATDEVRAPRGGPESTPTTPPTAVVRPAVERPAAGARRAPDVEPVAIVGMAGMLPGSADLDEFWSHLVNGDDLVTEVPPDRWDWQRIYGDPEPGAFRTRAKWGGFLHRVDTFDPLFFGISPREAEAMDPQHRLFLQTAWACIEDAGIRPGSLAGSDTAVFVGASTYDYFEVQHAFGVALEGYNTVGRAHAMLSNRLSYLLDLHGPSETIDTACSSSLVAVHRAAEAIRSGECVAALAGGVNVITSPTLFVDMSLADMLSPDGRCRTFDAGANGIVRAEGVGVVLLKRLSAALADGDVIHGTLLGSAINHGGRTNSLTAPNPDAQARAVVRAHERAGVDPRTVTFVETHGTGTALGDPVEIDGLKTAFAELYRRWQAPPASEPHCALGAVKSNTGHLEAGAGIAGLLKVLLAMRHGTVPGNLHIEQLNPYLRLDGSPFHVPRGNRAWLRPTDGQGREVPRRAGVSSFGLGGVNAHVVVEEPVASPPPVDPAPGPGLFVLSARDGDRLRAYAERLVRWLDGADAVDLAAVSYTLQTGREEMAQRLAVVADDAAGLRDKLFRWLAGADAVPGVWTGSGDRRGGVDLLLDGPEGGEYLRLVLAAGNLDKLARLWVGGASIDWSALWAGRAPRRIPLPSYPFAAQRFWIRPGPAFDELQVDGYGLAAAPATDGPAPDGPAGARSDDPAQVEAVRTPAAPVSPAPSRTAEAAGQDIETTLTQRVRALLAAHLGVTPDGLRLDRALSEYGVDSLGLRRLGRSLEAEFGIQIPGRFFATDDSVRRLTSRLLDGYRAQIAAAAADRGRPQPENLPPPGGGGDVPAHASGGEVPAHAGGGEVLPHASGGEVSPDASGGEVSVPASGDGVSVPASGGDDVLEILVRGLRSGQVSVEQALAALNGRTAR